MALTTTIEQEKLVFAFMLSRPKYFTYIDSDSFNNQDVQYLVNCAKEFYMEFKEAPSSIQMKSIVRGGKREMSNETIDAIYDVDLNMFEVEYLTKLTEGFIRYRKFNHNLFNAATLMKTSDISLSNVDTIVEKCTNMIAETNLVRFDSDLGDDFFDVDSHRNIVENKISSTWEYFNKVSHGGLDPKTLTCYIGGTNVGKSIVLCNDAAYFTRTGRNVLFISCEMAKEKVTRRISANLFDMTLEEYDSVVNSGNIKRRLAKFVQQQFIPPGKLRVKEFPTGQATVLDIESLIKEVQETLKYKIDVVIIDYINIMCNYRNPNSENTYLKVKTLAEDLRGLAVKYDVLMITASQIGRGALDGSDINLTDISESMGLTHTVDNCLGIIQTEDMRVGELIEGKAVPYYWMKILKIREGEGKGHKFRVDINYSKMKLIERTDCVDTSEHLRV